MKIIPTAIAGVVVVKTEPFRDERGSFTRFYCDNQLESILGTRKILQINHSHTSAKGTIRGLHFQNPPHAEMKLVRCLKGRIWDVAVDLRANSPTFLQWHAEELVPDNAHMLVIPEGCAHGFQTLEVESELLYLHTNTYQPSAESGVAYNDPILYIAWPLPVSNLSDKDKNNPSIDAHFTGIVL